MAVWKRVRITDVAARAGDDVGTVSHMMNGSPQVRESTRARVLEAIEQVVISPRLSLEVVARRSTSASPRAVAMAAVSAVPERAPP